MSGDYHWESKNCTECGRVMNVLAHKKFGPGAVPLSSQMYKAMDSGMVKASFRCFECGRYYCYNCSFIDKTCKCGNSVTWNEVLYAEVKKKGWLSRVFGSFWFWVIVSIIIALLLYAFKK